MRTTADNNTLTVLLEGRIDTNNAAQAESELIRRKLEAEFSGEN